MAEGNLSRLTRRLDKDDTGYILYQDFIDLIDSSIGEEIDDRDFRRVDRGGDRDDRDRDRDERRDKDEEKRKVKGQRKEMI